MTSTASRTLREELSRETRSIEGMVVSACYFERALVNLERALTKETFSRRDVGKLAGTDKKLSRSLDAEVVTAMASSPTSLGTSPVGPLTEANSRKTLIYLILTLNHIYPDYDFSSLRAEHFTKEGTLSDVKTDIESLLMESGKVWAARYGEENGESFLEVLWKTIDAAIEVFDCDVYSYKAVTEGDPFTDDGNLWSFNYFFYNKKLKRILYFSMHATSKTMLGIDSDDELANLDESGEQTGGTGYNSYDDDSMLFDDMDME